MGFVHYYLVLTTWELYTVVARYVFIDPSWCGVLTVVSDIIIVFWDVAVSSLVVGASISKEPIR